MKPKIIAVVGPTAIGKSALAITLARRFGGEVISCDSMQVYRGMDIGTAKVTQKEMQGVPHHLIDIVSPDAPFSCAEYATLAKNKIEEMTARGVLPIFCGGTGQYLDAVLTDNVFSDAGVDPELRARLSARDAHELWDELSRVDPESAEAIHENNKKRVVRALETFYLTGQTKTEWDRCSRTAQRPYHALILGLCVSEREVLYRRIDARVDAMIAQGLIDEVRALGLDPATTAGAAIGYKELYAYLRGEQSLDEAVGQIKRASRRYAKRQMTWFKSNPDIHWFETDRQEPSVIAECAVRAAEKFLKEENG